MGENLILVSYELVKIEISQYQRSVIDKKPICRSPNIDQNWNLTTLKVLFTFRNPSDLPMIPDIPEGGLEAPKPPIWPNNWVPGLEKVEWAS